MFFIEIDRRLYMSSAPFLYLARATGYLIALDVAEYQKYSTARGLVNVAALLPALLYVGLALASAQNADRLIISLRIVEAWLAWGVVRASTPLVSCVKIQHPLVIERAAILYRGEIPIYYLVFSFLLCALSLNYTLSGRPAVGLALLWPMAASCCLGAALHAAKTPPDFRRFNERILQRQNGERHSE